MCIRDSGATLYTAVEGRSPFRRTSPLSTLQAVVEEEAAEPRYAGHLDPVISALLRKDPATRPGTTEAEQLLAEAAEGRRPSGAQAFVPTQYGGPDGATDGTGTPYTSTGTGTPYTSHTTGTGTGTPYGTTGTGTPYAPEASASAPVGPTVIGAPDAVHAPASARGRIPERPTRRRRLRTLALVVAVAALVGGGTAVVLQQFDGGGGPQAGVSTSPSPSATGTPGPDTWVPVVDPLGFGLSLPKGWEREVYQDDGDLKQIDYTPDGGEHFVRIAVDTSPDFDDPYAHQKDLEEQLQRLVAYRTVTLEKNVYRDRAGSEWEYTWTALAKDTEFPGPRRAIEETYISRSGTEYVIYMSSPADDWTKTAQQFTSVLRSWREPGAS